LSKIQITYKHSSIKAILTLAIQNPEHRNILLAGINRTFKVTDQVLIDLVMLTTSQRSVISAISKFIHDYLEPKHKALGNKASVEVTDKEYKISIYTQEAKQETVINDQQETVINNQQETVINNQQETVAIY